jgi:hypothetical protein
LLRHTVYLTLSAKPLTTQRFLEFTFSPCRCYREKQWQFDTQRQQWRRSEKNKIKKKKRKNHFRYLEAHRAAARFGDVLLQNDAEAVV